jgi:tight adherence protein B
MPFALNELHLFYLFVAVSAILIGEAIYLLFYSAAAFRSRVNRRLRLSLDKSDRQSTLIQLRQERGLTAAGGFRRPVVIINRLVVQSGLRVGFNKLGLIVLGSAGVMFAVIFATRGSLLESVGITVAGVLFLPLFGVIFLRKRRQAKFSEQLPDALDIIVRSLRAGHPVPVAIGMVGREMPDPIGTEFGMIADEMTYGADMESAVRNMEERVGQDDLPLFVTAVAIQGSTGGKLGEILENLSSVIRQRFKMRRKIRALASEARFSALVLTSLPIVILIAMHWISPKFYESVWHVDMTKIALALAAGWMMLGNLVMYRLVKFRI